MKIPSTGREARFWPILDTLPCGIIETDAQGVIRGANEEAMQMLGLVRDDVANRFVGEFMRVSLMEDGSPCTLEQSTVKAALSTGRPQGPAVRGFERPDGTVLWHIVRTEPIVDEVGKVMGAITTFVDITERRRAEHALRESEQKWRSLAENSPDFVVLADREARILSVNRTLDVLEADMVIGHYAYEFVDPADVAEWRRHWAEALETRTPRRFETRGVSAEGPSAAWYDTSVVPVLDRGEIVHVLLVSRDITDRKRAEDALRKSEHRWRSFSEHAPDAMVVMDRDAKIVSINRTTGGVTEGSLVGVSGLSFVYPGYEDEWRARFEEAVSTRKVVRFETRATPADGVPQWYDTILVPLAEQAGEVDRVLVVARDVSERKRTEQALRESEQKWRSFSEHSPDFVLVLDSDARVQSVNRRPPSANSIDATIGRDATDFVDRSYVDDWRRRFARVLSTRATERFEVRGVSAGWYDLSMVPLPSEGEVSRVLLVARDVTERRALLASIAEKDRLASVGMLSASVAHEVMNPLTYVLASLELALSPKITDESRRREALLEAREGARRMQQIVSDLRSLGRSGTAELFYVDVRSTLETAVRLSGPELVKKGQIVLELEPVPGVVASESRLVQVFINLLVNAAQSLSSSREGVVRVRTRHDEAAELVAVEVEDTGVGISPDSMGRVFDPFYTTKRSGTGLGLSICRDIVETMGGRLEVESTPGEGSTFTVWLPTRPRS